MSLFSLWISNKFLIVFLCLLFLFLIFKKIILLIIGGQKKGFAPNLIIGGHVPGLPPRVYAYD